MVEHTGTIWRWSADGKGSWHFLTLDGDAAEAIAAHEAMRRLELGAGSGGRRGFGSVKVTARIGASAWTTSVFPSKDQGGFVLPIKAAIRKAQDIGEGSVVSVTLELL